MNDRIPPNPHPVKPPPNMPEPKKDPLTIKRWKLNVDYCHEGIRRIELVEDPTGPLVSYEDYKTIADILRRRVEQEALKQVAEGIYQQRIDSGDINREKNQTIARLKAEVDEIVNDNIRLTQDNGGLRGERDRLKADIERLRKDTSMMLSVYSEHYERLRFAGDILAFTLAHGDRHEYGDPSEPIEEYMNRPEIKSWNAAKEGKPSV